MGSKRDRDEIAGPDSGPEAPFPIQISGRIVRGFGRGSKELGIPTANLPISGLDVGGEEVASGVYYGWASICLSGAVAGAAEASGPVAPENHQSSEQASTTSSAPEQAAKTSATPSTLEYEIYPAVLSIGYNPYYKNEVRSVEVHVMHKFEDDFYNAMMNLSILGFIRKELDYTGLQDLIDDINFDITVADRSLKREAYQERKSDAFLKEFKWG